MEQIAEPTWTFWWERAEPEYLASLTDERRKDYRLLVSRYQNF
jgi:hypothetical protein